MRRPGRPRASLASQVPPPIMSGGTHASPATQCATSQIFGILPHMKEEYLVRNRSELTTRFRAFDFQGTPTSLPCLDHASSIRTSKFRPDSEILRETDCSLAVLWRDVTYVGEMLPAHATMRPTDLSFFGRCATMTTNVQTISQFDVRA
jgi:hypothetical protein